jgi:aminopeptidase N
MIRHTLLVLLFVLAASSSRAQVIEMKSFDPAFPTLEHGTKRPVRLLDIIDTTHKRPFDVLSYQLLLDWRAPFLLKTHIFRGWNTITIAVTALTDTILLDATEMHIDTCWLNGAILSPAPQPDAAEHLTIPLAQSLRDPATPVVLKFAYTRTSQADDGFYFYPKHTIDTLDKNRNRIDTTAEDLAFTMSEPLDAHKWMPCMDLPYDKANSEISIIVPKGISAQSNGTLIRIWNNPDLSNTYVWKSDEPIATYLMVADASNWVVWQDYYHRISNPKDSVPVIYYAWPVDYYRDSLYSLYDAQNAYKKTPQMIAAYSARFGEYPFVKYAQVPVQPFAFGGMEHQTITTVNRVWLQGHSESGIAHELMHQWFGDKTTCETFGDIWLNESFATFGEAIWRESAYGYPSYQDAIAWDSKGYFVNRPNTIPIYNPPIDLVFNYATVYQKGSGVLDMLRHYVHNDSLFFHSLRDYSAHFANSTANTAQFEDFMSRRLGIDLTEFMDAWIYGAAHPIYEIGWGQRSDNRLTIKVNQTQTVRDHFTMPMQFQVFHGAKIDTLNVFNNSRSANYYFSLGYAADSLRFDSSSVVISLHSVQRDDRLAVPLTAASVQFLRLSNTGVAIDCQFDAASAGSRLFFYDILGHMIETQSLSSGQTHAEFSLPASSGVYLVRLVLSSGMIRSSKLAITR